MSGLAAGSIYALLAIGLALIYQVSGIVNFAQSALATFGVYTLWNLSGQNNPTYGLPATGATGLPFWLASVLCAGVVFVLGALLHGLLLRPLRRAPAASVVVTLGLLIVLEGGIGWHWGYSNQSFALPISRYDMVPGTVSLAWLDVITIAATAALIALLFLFLRYTRAGAALRAVAQSPRGARLVGVRVDRVQLAAWGLSAVIAAAAGVLLAGGTYTALTPTLTDLYLLYAFAGAIIGGLDSLVGAAAGALLIGLIQKLVGLSALSPWRDPIIFLLLLAVLLVRPAGLFGTAVQRRV